ncbi:MAG: hypothetical protein Q9184_001136 [Pyrenodesmia sp. 2 TL-2023]
MDTTAYLTRQGWRGTGHALHPSGNGIKKPVLLSKKNNLLGVGKGTHDAQADQWWSRAFDETLRSINGDGPAKKATEAPDAAAATRSAFYASKWNGSGGLYGNFVRGNGLKGTLEAKKEVKDIGLDDGLPIERSRLNKSEKCERRSERKSAKKSLDQPAMDPQLPQHNSGTIEPFQKGEPSNEPDPDVVPVDKASSPLLKPPKKKKHLQNPKADTARSIEAVAAYAEIQFGASIERGMHNSTRATALLQVVDRIPDVAPASLEARERSKRERQRRLDKGGYSTGSIRNHNGSENRSERRGKIGTKRQEDTNP